MVLSRGDVYEVRHPEFARLSKGRLYVGLPTDNAEIPQRAVFCPMLRLAVESVGGTTGGEHA